MHVINHEWNRSMFVASAVCFVWDTKRNLPIIGIRAKFSYHDCIASDWILELKKNVFLIISGSHQGCIFSWFVRSGNWNCEGDIVLYQ